MNSQRKHAQKVDYFTWFESFSSTNCCSNKFLPSKIGWMCKVVCLHCVGGKDGLVKKVTV